MLLYRFKTKSADDIDIPRISEENKDVEALVVIVNDPIALLLLHKKFIEKFIIEDDIRVGSNRLYPTWEFDRFIARPLTNNRVSFYYDSTSPKIPYHRASLVVVGEIQKIAKQLQVARNYERCFEVKVHSL